MLLCRTRRNMHSVITSLLDSYGYAVLFLLVGLESLGIPLPGETALVTAAAFAASGHMSIYMAPYAYCADRLQDLYTSLPEAEQYPLLAL